MLLVFRVTILILLSESFKNKKSGRQKFGENKMQILKSGSFVNLDNQEKIDHLIFTAKAIADSAAETDGFQSSEENNKRLALEIWQGAEYLTREHERARVQNIFVGNFLDRLSEIAPAVVATTNASPETCETPATESDASKDEFLGFVTTKDDESREIRNPAERAEKTGATISIENLPPDDEISGTVRVENIEPERKETAEILIAETSAKNQTSETPEIEAINSSIIESVKPNQSFEEKLTGISPTGKSEKPAVRPITLPEKEPYRFDDCTVTATIQLLPAETGKRKVVLSVRTHDFSPQISVVELVGAATPEKFAPALAEIFEKYKADLPVKVMDKMKRDKAVGKKGAGIQAQETKTSAPAADQSIGAQTQVETKTVATTVAAPANNQAAALPADSQSVTANRSKPNVKNSKPEVTAQGNLFGF